MFNMVGWGMIFYVVLVVDGGIFVKIDVNDDFVIFFYDLVVMVDLVICCWVLLF